MAQWASVHLMFCEGPHDAAFLNRLLKTQLEFRKIELKLSDLPYPISNVLQKSFKSRASEDLRLDLAKKFFLPDYLTARGQALVMIFNYGGSNRKSSMSPFLESLFLLLSTPELSDSSLSVVVPSFDYIIFTDADVIGLSGAQAKVSADLATIGGTAWLGTQWANLEGTTAVMQGSTVGRIAAYIWKKWTEDNGTLEDVVLECLLDDAGLQKTLQFLDARFSWAVPAEAMPAEVCAIAAKRLKAAFCVDGQRKKPGMSLGVILDQTDLLSRQAMERSMAVQDCLTFLRAWLPSDSLRSDLVGPEADI